MTTLSVRLKEKVVRHQVVIPHIGDYLDLNQRRKKMTTKGNLTRQQVIELVGEEAVTELEGENCEPTGRVGYNGACQGDDSCEWSASIHCEASDGQGCTLVAYYYTSNEEDQEIADAGDGGAIDWQITGYEVV